MGQSFKAAMAALITATLLAGCGADVSADRAATASAAGIVTVRILGDAGTIEVIGDDALEAVNVTGTAYATSTGRVENIQFVLRPDGDELVIEARSAGPNSRFDIVVAIPTNLAVAIDTGAGGITVRDVRSVELRIGAGNITVDRVSADVLIDSVGAGNLVIANVGGRVDVRNVGSGNIDITTVGAGVAVGQVGTGNVTVRDVGGDLTVGNLGVGNVTHSEVRGAVSVR